MSMIHKDAEDAEDHEIFDINDFTTASDWERFIVSIEEIINEWKLNSSPSDNQADLTFANGEWTEKAETLQFADFSFTFTFHELVPKQGAQPAQSTSPSKPQSSPRGTGAAGASNDLSLNADFESFSVSLPDTSTTVPKPSNLPHHIPGLDDESSGIVNLPPKSMADLLNQSNDFQMTQSYSAPTPLVAYWYGLCKFVIIKPTRATDFLASESKANVLLSSASIAINNTGCIVPIFVQIQPSQRNVYIGLCEGSALKTHFKVIHFSYIPVQFGYLPGLLEIFKSKLGSHLANSSLLISVSVRFTYLILENTFIDWQQTQTNRALAGPSYASNVDKKLSLDIELVDNNQDEIYPNIRALPFGATQDCIDSIYLSCVWSNLSEDIIVDSDSFSDLNPQQSNDWSITVNNICDRCDLQLTSLLIKFTDELKRTIGVNQLLGPGLSAAAAAASTDNVNEELKWNSLEKLSAASSNAGTRRLDRMYNLSSAMMEKAANKMKALSLNDPSYLPLDKGFLDFIMDWLFPDANLAASFKNKPANKVETLDMNDKSAKSFMKKLNLMKSSSLDNTGLLNKLTVSIAIVTSLGGTKALAQLWREFLLELRFRYDSVCVIPNLTTNSPNQTTSENVAPPDLSRCLLHQKLQLLNCCINKRLERQMYELNMKKNKEEIMEQQSGSPNESGSSGGGGDDDEFFDCEEQVAEGRLKKFEGVHLINKPSEALYVPITQESTPMTEDMLEQHASVLVNLGSDEDASLLRAKIQSASLLSDMQSFKAANPGCILEDFVRWYSPRDFVEVEEKVVDPSTNEETVVKKYELSGRMKLPGNIWSEVWKSAKPVPVRRQKRLFDDTKEAENVFEWLNSLSVGQVAEQLLPILFYSAIYSAYCEVSKVDLNAFLDPTFDVLIDKTIKISRTNEVKKYQDVIGHLKSIEQIVSIMNSLKAKFLSKKVPFKKNDPEVLEFLKKITRSVLTSESSEIKIENGAHSKIGKLITRVCHREKTASNRRKRAFAQHSKYERVGDEEGGELSEKKVQLGVEGDSFDDENDESDDVVDDLLSDLNFLTGTTDELLLTDTPVKREYILRSSLPRPAPYSRQSPQRMYCLMTGSEFRLAGAFTEDTMFF